MLDNRYCDLMRETLNTTEEERIRYYADNVNYLTLNSFRYYANDVGYLTLNSFARNTIEKQKPDIFEVLDRLLFPCDPIRDWSEREIKKIEENFKPIERLIDFEHS